MGEGFMSYHSDPLIRDYEDRGMAKWMGFYLSEHTAEMEKEREERETFWVRKPQMNDLDISMILEKAYMSSCLVEIQLDELNPEGYAYADIIGVIEGFRENSIFVSNPEAGIQVIPGDSINHISLIDPVKWSKIP
ncbi:hypothetical protein [Enterococcus sp. AZ109]|uniref:hypothetical protein n=1 Tax=Enterococcus sp. AZ109 TaxID=2774634 RepID=UPI003F28991E